MKFLRQAQKYGAKALAVGAAVSLPLVVNATPTTDYDAIVAAVDWADVITGIGAIGALIAAVMVVRRGVKMLIRMI